MPIREKRQELVYAHFFSIDIVGLSNPKMSSTIQIKKLRAFHSMLTDCDAYKNTPQQEMISFPTGDGMCIGFTKDPELPILLAIQIHQKLYQYNKGKIPNELIQVRIGIHSGNCFYFTDIQERKNVWGPGVIIAKRVMDIGNANHILLTSRIAEDLCELSDEYMQIIKPVQDYAFKHGVVSLIYSAFGKNFGNSTPPPQSLPTKSTSLVEVKKLQNSALYPSIFVSLDIVNVKKMMVHHKRTYHIKNIVDSPIQYVLHGIGTDVEKQMLSDLNVKTYDDSGNMMKISNITINEPFTKEFSTAFEKSIHKGQQRSYTLEYDVEEPERFFDNNFAVECDKFTLSISYPDNTISPKLYDLNQETEVKTKNKTIPQTSKNKKTTIIWTLENLTKGQTIRLEW